MSDQQSDVPDNNILFGPNNTNRTVNGDRTDDRDERSFDMNTTDPMAPPTMYGQFHIDNPPPANQGTKKGRRINKITVTHDPVSRNLAVMGPTLCSDILDLKDKDKSTSNEQYYTFKPSAKRTFTRK